MKYKLLVLDLDGTLTNKQKKITPHTKETLLKIQEQGVKIVLASGRPTYGIAPLAEQLELQKSARPRCASLPLRMRQEERLCHCDLRRGIRTDRETGR